MARKARIQRLEFPAGRRVLVVSDIHGSLPLFQGLLDKAGYGPDDILVLLGDLVEKGQDSLAVLRYVMDLSTRRTVYCVKGNCDDLVTEFVESPQVRPEFFHHYLNVWRNRCTLLQMGQEAGFETRSPEDLPALRQVILNHFGPELAFLDTMPEILLTPDYLFVHGGVWDEDHLEDMTAWDCMKNDSFLDRGICFRRWCIVGHTPVTLYHPHIPTTHPLVSEKQHIVSIDGGCALQRDAQLNALVLPQVIGFNAQDPRAAEGYGRLAKACGLAGNPRALAAALTRLRTRLKIAPRLPVSAGELREALPGLTQAALADGCLPANPRAVQAGDIQALLLEIGGGA